jgi:hypothetical protein
MSSISMVEARLPPGFRFHPRDDELVMDYLCRKLSSKGGAYGGIDMIDVDLNKCEPWDLPGARFASSAFVSIITLLCWHPASLEVAVISVKQITHNSIKMVASPGLEVKSPSVC